jgi:hypothetical protein
VDDLILVWDMGRGRVYRKLAAAKMPAKYILKAECPASKCRRFAATQLDLAEGQREQSRRERD